MAKEEKGGTPDPNGMSFDAGAGAILGLLNKEPGDRELDQEEASEEEVVDDAAEELEEDESEDDESEDDDDDEAADDDEDDDAAEEDDDDEDDEPAPTYKVKVAGEEAEVTLEEALKGYQRQQDYTRKTTKLAEDRNTVKARFEELTGLHTDYTQRLAAVKQQLTVQEPDWDEVKRSDPDNYLAKRDAFRTRQEQVGAIDAEIQRANTAMQEAITKRKGEIADEQRELLVAAVPEWVDPDTMQEDVQAMVETAQSAYKFTPEELSEVLDHRALLILRDATRWQKHEANAGKVEDTVRKTRKKGKTLVPGATKPTPTKKSRSAKRQRAAQQQLAKSGSIHDAAAAILATLDD